MENIKSDLMKNMEQIIEADLQIIYQAQKEQDKEYFRNELKKHLEAYVEATTNWAEVL